MVIKAAPIKVPLSPAQLKTFEGEEVSIEPNLSGQSLCVEKNEIKRANSSKILASDFYQSNH